MNFPGKSPGALGSATGCRPGRIFPQESTDLLCTGKVRKRWKSMQCGAETTRGVFINISIYFQKNNCFSSDL